MDTDELAAKSQRAQRIYKVGESWALGKGVGQVFDFGAAVGGRPVIGWDLEGGVYGLFNSVMVDYFHVPIVVEAGGQRLSTSIFSRQSYSQPEGESVSAGLRQESAINKADRIVAEELKRLRWTEQDLMRCRKSDPEKLRIAARLRRETILDMRRVLTIATVLGLIGVVETFIILVIARDWFHLTSVQIHKFVELVQKPLHPHKI